MSINSIGLGIATTAALAVSSVVAVAPAQALTFNFSNGGARTGPNEIVFTDAPSGITATATGSAAGGVLGVVQDSFDRGLGVRSRLFDSNQIDGFGADETLNLSLSKKVNLVSATFGAVGFDDDFRLLVGGSQFLDADIPFGNIFSFSPSPMGTQFGFTVTGFNDDYFLSAIEVTPVPTPAAVLPALIGMGTAAFRKKKREGEEEMAMVGGVEEV